MGLVINSVKKSNLGITLIEVIVVIGIIGILVSISTSTYNSFKAHENLQISTAGVVEGIRHAQTNAQIGKGDSDWGVKILPFSILIFKGSSYSGRDPSADQTLKFSGGVVASGSDEIVFLKLTGATDDAGTITLTNSYGTQEILINEKGTLTY